MSSDECCHLDAHEQCDAWRRKITIHEIDEITDWLKENSDRTDEEYKRHWDRRVELKGLLAIKNI